MKRRNFLLLSGIALAGATAFAARSPSFLSRYASLQGPDIEDWRDLPSRPVSSRPPQRPLPPGDTGKWAAAMDVMARNGFPGGANSFDALLTSSGGTAFIALHEGAVVREVYTNGYSATRPAKSFSISKSVLSALFGIAAGGGLISPSHLVGDYLASFEDAGVARLPLDLLLNCTAGFAYQRGNAPWHDQPRMYYTTDVRSFVRGVKLQGQTGTAFTEEDLSPLLLGVALEAALRKGSPGMTLSRFMSERLWGPMGAEADALWVIDAEKDGFEKVESGFVARARDFARFGQLFLEKGARDGRAVIPEAWVAQCASPPPPRSPNLFTDGYLHNFWWGALRPGMEQHDYFANGHFGQRIYICPDKKLVLVRLGGDNGGHDWTSVLGRVAEAWPA
jgi:CubicO group peptidase (beta-lactamase class C family)